MLPADQSLPTQISSDLTFDFSMAVAMIVPTTHLLLGYRRDTLIC